MKLLADENMDRPIVDFLRQSGHDVLWMLEHAAGMPDAEIIQLAQQEQRIILTFDRDFGELVFHSGHNAPGIILFRFDPQPTRYHVQLLYRSLVKIGDEGAG